MNAILIESGLFIAMLAVLAAFLITAMKMTPLGTRLKQTANRKLIEKQADLTCPIHGQQREADLVRLSTGEPLCPHCYREALNGHVD